MLGTFSRTSILQFITCFTMACLMVTCFTSCESHKVIVNALDEKEANEILVYLSTKGIAAEKQQSTVGTGPGAGRVLLWDIVVNARDATEALSLLNQSGLPRRRGQRLLDIFSGGGLVPSELEERIRFQQGLGQQIANTIRSIDGVLDAQVNLSFPEEDPLKPDEEKKEKITASVYVKHSGILDDPNTHLIPKIKRLVEGSISGLSYDNVTVVSDRARFGELPIGFDRGYGDDQDFVSIWSIVVAKDSAGRFRGMFFTFLVTTLFLVIGSIWLLWKVTPIIRQSGGWGRLFSLHPIISVEKPQEVTEGEEGEEGEGEEEGEGKQEEESATGEGGEEPPPTDVT